MQVLLVEGPAFLASALVNGDESGLSDADRQTLALFLEKVAPGAVVDVARDDNGEAIESSFGRFETPIGDLGGDVLDYVVHYPDSVVPA